MTSRSIGRTATGAAAMLAMGAVIAAACGSTGTSYSSSNSTPARPATVASANSSGTTASGSAGSAAYGSGYYGSGNAGTGDTSGGGATPGGASVQIGNTKLGKVLTDASGMTLYTFGNDVTSSGKSVCNGGCATNWPPLTIASGTPGKADGLTGDLTVITRDDGSKQVAYKGMPLYRYSPDKAPGDTKGQGIGNVWYVATP